MVKIHNNNKMSLEITGEHFEFLLKISLQLRYLGKVLGFIFLVTKDNKIMGGSSV